VHALLLFLFWKKAQRQKTLADATPSLFEAFLVYTTFGMASKLHPYRYQRM